MSKATQNSGLVVMSLLVSACAHADLRVQRGDIYRQALRRPRGSRQALRLTEAVQTRALNDRELRHP